MVGHLCRPSDGAIRAEPRRWGGHVQRLMWPDAVVVVDPLIESLLGDLEVREWALAAEEFSSQTAVEPLDLDGRGRTAWLGQQMVDAVFAADRLKEHLHRWVMKSAGEHLAVIGQDLRRRPVAGQRRTQPVADRAGALTGYHMSTDAHPRVIIDPRQCLGRGAIELTLADVLSILP